MKVNEVLVNAEEQGILSYLVIEAVKKELKHSVFLLNNILTSVRALSDDIHNVDVEGLFKRLLLFTETEAKSKYKDHVTYLSMISNSACLTFTVKITHDTGITVNLAFSPDRYEYNMEVESGEFTVFAQDKKDYSEGIELF
jgi:hypothetical protein